MSFKDRVLAFKNNKAAAEAAAAEAAYVLNTPQDPVDPVETVVESPAVQVPEGIYSSEDALAAAVGDDEVFFDEYVETPVQSFVIKAKNVHITLNISTKA